MFLKIEAERKHVGSHQCGESHSAMKVNLSTKQDSRKKKIGESERTVLVCLGKKQSEGRREGEWEGKLTPMANIPRSGSTTSQGHSLAKGE